METRAPWLLTPMTMTTTSDRSTIASRSSAFLPPTATVVRIRPHDPRWRPAWPDSPRADRAHRPLRFAASNVHLRRPDSDRQGQYRHAPPRVRQERHVVSMTNDGPGDAAPPSRGAGPWTMASTRRGWHASKRAGATMHGAIRATVPIGQVPVFPQLDGRVVDGLLCMWRRAPCPRCCPMPRW